MIGTTPYGTTVQLPGVCAGMSIQALLDLAERHGCVRLQNAAGDVFRRRARGSWAYSYTGATPDTITAKATDFRKWREYHCAEVIDLPDGSFKESGTGVSTKLVVIDK